MPIFLFFFMMLFLLLKNKTNKRANIALCALGVYIALIFSEQAYLELYFNMSYHLSDPSGYFDETFRLSFDQMIALISSDEYKSNNFYYILNWIFYNSFLDPTVTAIMLKITNCLAFLSAYLLLPQSNKKIDYIDYMLLFHPYLFVMLIRNVRDAYIIFFMVLFIYGFEKWQTHRLQFRNYILMTTSFAFMLTIRPFFSMLMLLIIISKQFIRLNWLTKFTVFSSGIILSSFVISSGAFGIRTKLISALFSALSYHEGYDADRDDVAGVLMQGDGVEAISLIEYIKSFIMGFPVFLFTPQPVNYGLKFLTEQKNGLWNIYTAFDNTLIVIGSIVNYLITFPLLLKFFHHIRSVRMDFVLITIYIIFVYSLLQLGITDVRIKYSFLFFLLFGLKLANLHRLSMMQDAKYFIGVFVIFFVVLAGAK